MEYINFLKSIIAEDFPPKLRKTLVNITMLKISGINKSLFDLISYNNYKLLDFIDIVYKLVKQNLKLELIKKSFSCIYELCSFKEGYYFFKKILNYIDKLNINKNYETNKEEEKYKALLLSSNTSNSGHISSDAKCINSNNKENKKLKYKKNLINSKKRKKEERKNLFNLLINSLSKMNILNLKFDNDCYYSSKDSIISNKFYSFCCLEYGSLIMQYIITMCPEESLTCLFSLFKGKLYLMTMCTKGVKIVELLILHDNKEVFTMFIKEVIENPNFKNIISSGNSIYLLYRVVDVLIKNELYNILELIYIITTMNKHLTLNYSTSNKDKWNELIIKMESHLQKDKSFYLNLINDSKFINNSSFLNSSSIIYDNEEEHKSNYNNNNNNKKIVSSNQFQIIKQKIDINNNLSKINKLDKKSNLSNKININSNNNYISNCNTGHDNNAKYNLYNNYNSSNNNNNNFSSFRFNSNNNNNNNDFNHNNHNNYNQYTKNCYVNICNNIQRNKDNSNNINNYDIFLNNINNNALINNQNIFDNKICNCNNNIRCNNCNLSSNNFINNNINLNINNMKNNNDYNNNKSYNNLMYNINVNQISNLPYYNNNCNNYEYGNSNINSYNACNTINQQIYNKLNENFINNNNNNNSSQKLNKQSFNNYNFNNAPNNMINNNYNNSNNIINSLYQNNILNNYSNYKN